MELNRESESFWIIRGLSSQAFEISRALDSLNIPGLLEATPSYESVGLYTDADVFDPRMLPFDLDLAPLKSKTLTVHVCYENSPDIDKVAENLGLQMEEVILLHSLPTYTCIGLGFCPGFAYLAGLPEKLCGLPRLDSPRKSVPAGSVGITGAQSAVYPSIRPGGWNLIGITPQTLVNVREAYFPIEPGDQVKFIPISESEMEQYRDIPI